ncbi:hypothetical protein KAI87_07600 [Myxococcota bacterium]|nr:hypothetical protein [Myxococcota bacterium]
MAKIVKRGTVNGGDISPDTGFSDVPSRRSGIIEKDTFEARSEGNEIRDRAKQKADEIIQQAQAEAEELKVQAHDEGYQEGKEQGAAELSEIIAKTTLRFQQIEEQVEPQLKELAITIARKILGRELEFAPEAIVDVVKQALAEKARQRREISLRVHPDDLQYIRDNKTTLLEVLSRAKEIAIREDLDVQRGGVIIETDAGIIDVQLDNQLAVFERILLESR